MLAEEEKNGPVRMKEHLEYVLFSLLFLVAVKAVRKNDVICMLLSIKLLLTSAPDPFSLALTHFFSRMVDGPYYLYPVLTPAHSL